jgi:hypothetical protein
MVDTQGFMNEMRKKGRECGHQYGCGDKLGGTFDAPLPSVSSGSNSIFIYFYYTYTYINSDYGTTNQALCSPPHSQQTSKPSPLLLFLTLHEACACKRCSTAASSQCESAAAANGSHFGISYLLFYPALSKNTYTFPPSVTFLKLWHQLYSSTLSSHTYFRIHIIAYFLHHATLYKWAAFYVEWLASQ